MQKNLNLRQKKVIDIDTAERVGSITDIDIDVTSGKIRSIAISKTGFLSFIHDSGEISVDWEDVAAIGSEYVLIKFKKNTKIGDKC